MPDRAANLPSPGLLWGLAPRRAQDDVPPAPGAWHGWRHYARIARQARVAQARWSGAKPPWLPERRAQWRRDGLRGDAIADALGCAAAEARRTLGRDPFDTQLLAAAVMLDGRLADMATGEGKTLAAALAAAAAALAGIPVHVVTANDYLAARDAAALAPFYVALGLSCAHLAPEAADAPRGAAPATTPSATPGATATATATATAATTSEAAKRSAYAADVLYATAKELAFDHLREQLVLGAAAGELRRRAAQVAGGPDAPGAITRGRCLAILDEADSILLDEADIPLVISRAAPHAGRRAFLWQALGVARQLEAPTHFELPPHDTAAALTPAGRARIGDLAAALRGPWQRARYREEAVTLALTGLHALRRGEHYLVRQGRVELLDAVTGRAAPGRVWSRGLHGVVELKEGLAPSPDTETLAQTSFQRFFLGYHRLAGMSGSLLDAAAELRAAYGLRVVRVPSRLPNRRIDEPTRVFSTAAARWAAVCQRVNDMQAAGRPVLVGTDSVADSQALSASLTEAGIAHRVLNALHDDAEAQIVALAGHAGQVTVATRMAGRGTDIVLDDAARAAGGLHVISCQRNPSRRLDRQLFGRCARQGDPGSRTIWFLTPFSGHSAASTASIFVACDTTDTRPMVALSAMWARWQYQRHQQREEARRRRLRSALFEQDWRWSRRLAFAGRA